LNVNQLVEHVQNAIDRGEKEQSLLVQSLLYPTMPGLSSNKVRHFFNNLCNIPFWKHLEIGVSTGSTLISAGYLNALAYMVSIDDFSMKPENKVELFSNLEKWNHALPRIYSIEYDCWGINVKGLGKFNTYFYDAFHSQAAQRKGITEYWECLEDLSVIVVDDYDVKRVNKGTMEGFERLGVENKIVKKWHLKGGNVKTRHKVWWGGLGVFVIDKGR